MTSDKKNASLLADIFIKNGLEHIVISPGSRNAPLTLSFTTRPEIKAIAIVDERSAAFFALGMAQQTGKAVAIACTSGSAVLNYAPAIAEAYYQKIPLLVLTADRPPDLINKGDGQTIRQKEVFANYIKKSFELSDVFDQQEEIDQAITLINEAIHWTAYPDGGPVHINLPFAEPLYNLTEQQVWGERIDFPLNPFVIDTSGFGPSFNQASKILVLAGQMKRDPSLNTLLAQLADTLNVVVLTETTSNLCDPHFVGCIDNVITTIRDEESEHFMPDLLITLGGQIVSKMVKKFLRKARPSEHWHISPSGEEMDTYFHLTHVIPSDPVTFFSAVLSHGAASDGSYASTWRNRKMVVENARASYLSRLPYCDLQVFYNLLTKLPENSCLHLGNSTPVRYSQLFGSRADITYYSNRGVSGIDGQISTAAGAAYISKSVQFIITGDLGFFYDSNALMNHHLKPNLKIVVINNGGGGIFRFIDGPAASPQLEEFFEVKHNWKAEQIARTFDVAYLKAATLPELEDVFPEFLSMDTDRPILLEIFTPGEKNALILREYFSYLRDQVSL